MLLGRFVSPIVMGLVFFLVVTPTGLIMKLFNKDYMILDEPHPDIKMVHFAGAEEKDTIHDYEDKFGWIKDNWHA